MKSKFISILAIILGLIIIIFPAMGLIKVHALIGLSILLISIYLLVVGVAIIDYNKSGAIIDLILDERADRQNIDVRTLSSG